MLLAILLWGAAWAVRVRYYRSKRDRKSEHAEPLLDLSDDDDNDGDVEQPNSGDGIGELGRGALLRTPPGVGVQEHTRRGLADAAPIFVIRLERRALREFHSRLQRPRLHVYRATHDCQLRRTSRGLRQDDGSQWRAIAGL